MLSSSGVPTYAHFVNVDPGLDKVEIRVVDRPFRDNLTALWLTEVRTNMYLHNVVRQATRLREPVATWEIMSSTVTSARRGSGGSRTHWCNRVEASRSSSETHAGQSRYVEAKVAGELLRASRMVSTWSRACLALRAAPTTLCSTCEWST